MRFPYRRLRVILVALVVVVVLVTGVFVAPRVADRLWPVDHQVAATTVGDLDIPGTVSEVGWEWQPPPGQTIRDMYPAVSGVVAVVSDGVVGINGVTGEEVWHYRRTDSGVQSHSVTPDGRSVAITFSSESTGDAEGLEKTIVLDAADGSLSHEYETPALEEETVPDERLRFRYVTNDSYVVPRVGSDGHLRVDAFSLATAEEQWSYGGEQEIASVGQVFVAEDVVIATGVVTSENPDGGGHSLVMVGLDASTGEPLWEVDRSFDASQEDIPDMRYEPGWGAVTVNLLEPGGESVNWLVDPLTGESLLETATYPGWVTGDGYITRSADPEAGLVHYSYMRFDGSEESGITVVERPGEAEIAPGIATPDGLLRLDYLEEESLLRGPVTLGVSVWGGAGTEHTIPLGFDTHERVPASFMATMDTARTPEMALVPGALVVIDQTAGSTHMVGLV
jgi:hypothetical protein